MEPIDIQSTLDIQHTIRKAIKWSYWGVFALSVFGVFLAIKTKEKAKYARACNNALIIVGQFSERLAYTLVAISGTLVIALLAIASDLVSEFASNNNQMIKIFAHDVFRAIRDFMLSGGYGIFVAGLSIFIRSAIDKRDRHEWPTPTSVVSIVICLILLIAVLTTADSLIFGTTQLLTSIARADSALIAIQSPP